MESVKQLLSIEKVGKDELINSIREIFRDELEKQRIRSLDELGNWTTDQTAQYCKVTKVTIWDWTKKGILKKYKIGGRVFYKPHEVKEAVSAKNL